MFRVPIALRTAILVAFCLPWNIRLCAQQRPAKSELGWFYASRTFESGEKLELWFSHEHQVYALASTLNVQFINGRERTRYDGNFRSKTITKYLVRDEWSPPPSRFDGPEGLGHWLYGVERIRQQRRQEVVRAERKWLEYDVLMSFGRSTRWIVKVDPETGALVSTATPGADKPAYVFEHRADGPRDIYAFGFPRDAKINDLMPSPELAKVLAEMSRSRRLLGTFRMYFNENSGERIIWRKGKLWREDHLQRPELDRATEPPPGPERERWWNEQLAIRPSRSLLLSDGNQVFRNMAFADRNKPPDWTPDDQRGVLDLLNADVWNMSTTSILQVAYPDLHPQPGEKFELVLKPTTGPSGCILYKRSSAHTGGARGHGWYYLDPDRGYSVVRKEYFDAGLSDTAPSPDISSMLYSMSLDGYERSPSGFWYPTSCRIEWSKRDVATGIRHVTSSEMIRYHLDFSEVIPDSLFGVKSEGEK